MRIFYRIGRKLGDFLFWICQHLPYWCDCGHVTLFCRVRSEYTTWGERVTFCPRCWEERFKNE